MYRLTVLYGHPNNPNEFDSYYVDTHIPLAKKMQGLKGWTIGKCEGVSGAKPPFYMIVGLYPDTREEMEAIIATPAGQAAVNDVSNFATGGVEFIFDDEQVLIPVSLED